MGNPLYNRLDIGMRVLKWNKRQKLNSYQLEIGERELGLDKISTEIEDKAFRKVQCQNSRKYYLHQ